MSQTAYRYISKKHNVIARESRGELWWGKKRYQLVEPTPAEDRKAKAFGNAVPQFVAVYRGVPQWGVIQESMLQWRLVRISSQQAPSFARFRVCNGVLVDVDAYEAALKKVLEVVYRAAGQRLPLEKAKVA